MLMAVAHVKDVKVFAYYRNCELHMWLYSHSISAASGEMRVG
jgi:hypothetical protein